jgi:hypothetical protein
VVVPVPHRLHPLQPQGVGLRFFSREKRRIHIRHPSHVEPHAHGMAQGGYVEAV